MAEKVDFKTLLKGEIAEPKTKADIKVNENSELKDFTFVLPNKEPKKKPIKKSFPVYVDENKLNKVDAFCKERGYSRNELFNLLIDGLLSS